MSENHNLFDSLWLQTIFIIKPMLELKGRFVRSLFPTNLSKIFLFFLFVCFNARVLKMNGQIKNVNNKVNK